MIEPEAMRQDAAINAQYDSIPALALKPVSKVIEADKEKLKASFQQDWIKQGKDPETMPEMFKPSATIEEQKRQSPKNALLELGLKIKFSTDKYVGWDAVKDKCVVAHVYNNFATKNKVSLTQLTKRCYSTLKDKKGNPAPGLTEAENTEISNEVRKQIESTKAAISVWNKEHPYKPPVVINPPRDNGKKTIDVAPEAYALIAHTELCISALSEIYNKPEKRIFVRNGALVDISPDEKNNFKISDINRERVRNILERCCNFVRYEETEQGGLVMKLARASRDIFENVIASNDLHKKLPALHGMTEAPYITSEGRVVTHPGYDENTGIFFAPAPDYTEEIKIPETPTDKEVNDAVKHIDDLFQDFQFDGDIFNTEGKLVEGNNNPSRDNLIAAVFTSVLRPSIDGNTPMYLVDKPQMGTGGSMLCDIIQRIATGKALESSNAPKSDDEEWEKKIVSILHSGTPAVCFDNIIGVFNSAALASAMTSRVKKCRVLGTTNDTSYPINVNWMGNGINVSIGGDIPRRIYLSRMISTTSRPQQRTDFAIPNILKHVSDHRYEYVRDVLIIAKAYYNSEKKVDPTIPIIGSFEEWRLLVGGIMTFIKKTQFLGNTEDILNDCESQGDDEDTLLSVIEQAYGSGEFSAKNIIDGKHEKGLASVYFTEALPVYIANAEGRKARMLNTHFRKIRDKVFSSGRKLIHSREDHHTHYWIVKNTQNKKTL